MLTMEIDRPIIIIGAPRSGTTILQRCLAMHPEVWHLRAESHAILEGPFHPAKTRRTSNRCTAEDITCDALAEHVRQAFYRQAINLNCVLPDPTPLLSTSGFWGRAFSFVAVKVLGMMSKCRKPERIRFLEKTPKNALRIPLLDRLFPEALFVWNRRRPEENIDSLIAGWQSEQRIGPVRLRRFARAGYPVADRLQLKDYQSKWWKFAWVPGWEKLRGKTVANVAAWQYYQCNRFSLEDFAAVDDERVFMVQHEDFVRQPSKHVASIFQRAGLSYHPVVDQFVADFPKVNDTNQKERSANGLRFPKEVHQAIEELPELSSLTKKLGY